MVIVTKQLKSYLCILRFRSPVTNLLMQLLKVGVEKREHQIAILRTWCQLEPHATAGSAPLPLGCHSHLRFRPPKPVHQFLQDTRNGSGDDQVDVNLLATSVPFRCVLAREPVDWFDHPHGLSALIEATIDVINLFTPASVSNTGSTNQDADDNGEGSNQPPVPSFEAAFRGFAHSTLPVDTSLCCLPSDFFLSLIAVRVCLQ